MPEFVDLTLSIEDVEMSPILLGIRVLLGIVALAGNGILIYLFFKFKSYQEQFSNVLITLLATADVITGVGLLTKAGYSLAPAYTPGLGFDRLPCALAGMPQAVGIICSNIMFISIAADRLMAVKMMKKYLQLNARARITTIVVSWVLSGTLVLGFLVGTLPADKSLFCSIGAVASDVAIWWYLCTSIFSGIVVLVLYGYALFLLKKLTTTGHKTPTILMIQQKVFKSITVLVVFYVLFCMFPMIICLAFMIIKARMLMGLASIFVGLASEFNSCLGIFIYFLKHEEVRKHLRTMVGTGKTKVIKLTATDQFPSPLQLVVVNPSKRNSAPGKF